MSNNINHITSIEHVFKTSGLMHNKENDAIVATDYEVKHLCRLEQHSESYDVTFINLLGVLSEGNQCRDFIFDTKKYPKYPINAYSQGSRITYQKVLHRYGQVCAHGTNLFSFFCSKRVPNPNDPNGIRIELGDSGRYIDVPHNHEDDILKCTLAIDTAQVLHLLGGCGISCLLSWIRNHIPALHEDDYANFPALRCIEQLAQFFLEGALASTPDNSAYGHYVYKVCTHYIDTYNTFLATIEDEFTMAKDKSHKDTSLNYCIKLQEIHRMVVGTLRQLLYLDESEHAALKTKCLEQIDIPGKDDQALCAYLNKIIKGDTIELNTPIIRYMKVEEIDNLEEFCTYCQTYDIDLSPTNDLEKALNKSPKLLPVINQLILEKALNRSNSMPTIYTLGELNERIHKEECFLAQLKKDLFTLALHLCGYLHIPKWTSFEEIDFETLRTHYDKLHDAGQKWLLKKLHCPLKKWPHYIDFFEYVCGSVRCGYFRIPSRPDCCVELPDIDRLSQIDNLPFAYKQTMRLLTHQKLHYLMYLLTINQTL